MRFLSKNTGCAFAKIACAALLLALTVSACGIGGENAEEAEEETYFEEPAAVDTGAMSDDSVVIAVGNTTITYGEYKAYYYFMESQYKDLLGEEVWTQKVDGEKTIGQEAIEEVLRLIIQVKVICKEAEKEGVTLEADEKEDADYNAEKYVKSLGDQVTRENGLTTQMVTKIFEENKLAEKMYRVVTGKVDVNMTAEEQKAYRVQLLFIKAGSDKEATRAEAEELQREISGSSKSFYYYAEKESDLDEIETVIGMLDERKNLLNTISSMKLNVVSSVIEESDGFYIALVLEKPNDEINAEYQNEIITERQTDAFQEAYGEWSESYGVDVSDSLLSD